MYEWYNEKNKHFYLAIKLELADMSLYDMIIQKKKLHIPIFEYETIINFIKQSVNGLKYLKEKKIFHLNIKPENILFKNNILKLSDFGLSKTIENSQACKNA